MWAKKTIVSFLCVLYNFQFWNLEDFGLQMCLHICFIYAQDMQEIKDKFGTMTFLGKELLLRILPERILAVVCMCHECLKYMLHMIFHLDTRH